MAKDDHSDGLRRVYARLEALRDNLPERTKVEEEYVSQFHGALTKLASLGLDAADFHVPEESVQPSRYIIDGVIKNESEEKYVDRAMLRSKIEETLAYFDLSDLLSDEPVPREIGFAAPN